MLSKSDIRAIGDLIDTKLEDKLESKLEEKLESKLEQKLESKFEEKLGPIRNDISTMRKDIRKIRKDSTFVAGILDQADIQTRLRVDKLERHLGFP